MFNRLKLALVWVFLVYSKNKRKKSFYTWYKYHLKHQLRRTHLLILTPKNKGKKIKKREKYKL